MPLPIIPGSEVQTPASGVQLDPTAFRNAALARGKVGAAIGQDAGGFLQDLANNIQDARNAKTVFKADLAMKQAYSNFTLQLQKDPQLNDPEKWLPAWSQQVDQIKDSVLNQKNLGPAVKAHLERMTGNWEQQTTTDVQMNALKRETADTKEAGLKDVNWNYNTGELAAGDAGVDAMLEARVLPGPKTAAALKKQGRSTWVLSQANSAISTAGYKAPDVLKQVLDANPGLVPAKQARILTDNALAAQRRAQSDKEQQVRDMVISDPSHALEDSRIDGMKKEGIISDRGAADLRTLRDKFAQTDKVAQARQETQELSIAMMEVDSQADALSGPGWQAKVGELNALGNTWTDEHKIKQLHDHVNMVAKNIQNLGRAEEKPIIHDQLQFMEDDFKARLGQIPIVPGVPSKPEFFGLMHTTAEAPKYAVSVTSLERMTDAVFKQNFPNQSRGEIIKLAQDYVDQERLRYSTARTRFLAWANDPLNAKEAADPEKAQKQREYFTNIQEHPNVSKDEFARLMPGDPYWFNGKQFIK